MREKGKTRLSKYFQKFKEGERVSLVLNPNIKTRLSVPSRIWGRTGVIESRRGSSYVVRVADGSKEKRFIIYPVHLRRIQK